MEADKAKFLKDQEDFKKAHRVSWEVDVQEKQRFFKMVEDKEAFEEAVKSRRAADFAALQVCTFAHALHLLLHVMTEAL